MCGPTCGPNGTSDTVRQTRTDVTTTDAPELLQLIFRNHKNVCADKSHRFDSCISTFPLISDPTDLMVQMSLSGQPARSLALRALPRLMTRPLLDDGVLRVQRGHLGGCASATAAADRSRCSEGTLHGYDAGADDTGTDPAVDAFQRPTPAVHFAVTAFAVNGAGTSVQCR